MGTLKPGVRYIYESPDGGKTVYMREEGATERVLVGYHLPKRVDPLDRMQEYCEIHFDEELWADMHRIANQHPTLQKALDQCKATYHMIKEANPTTIQWHPV